MWPPIWAILYRPNDGWNSSKCQTANFICSVDGRKIIGNDVSYENAQSECKRMNGTLCKTVLFVLVADLCYFSVTPKLQIANDYLGANSKLWTDFKRGQFVSVKVIVNHWKRNALIVTKHSAPKRPNSSSQLFGRWMRYVQYRYEITTKVNESHFISQSWNSYLNITEMNNGKLGYQEFPSIVTCTRDPLTPNTQESRWTATMHHSDKYERVGPWIPGLHYWWETEEQAESFCESILRLQSW